MRRVKENELKRKDAKEKGLRVVLRRQVIINTDDISMLCVFKKIAFELLMARMATRDAAGRSCPIFKKYRQLFGTVRSSLSPGVP